MLGSWTNVIKAKPVVDSLERAGDQAATDPAKDQAGDGHQPVGSGTDRGLTERTSAGWRRPDPAQKSAFWRGGGLVVARPGSKSWDSSVIGVAPRSMRAVLPALAPLPPQTATGA